MLKPADLAPPKFESVEQMKRWMDKNVCKNAIKQRNRKAHKKFKHKQWKKARQ